MMEIYTDNDVPSKQLGECPDCDCDCACDSCVEGQPKYTYYGGTCISCGQYTMRKLPEGQGEVEVSCPGCGRIVVLVEGN